MSRHHSQNWSHYVLASIHNSIINAKDVRQPQKFEIYSIYALSRLVRINWPKAVHHHSVYMINVITDTQMSIPTGSQRRKYHLQGRLMIQAIALDTMHELRTSEWKCELRASGERTIPQRMGAELQPDTEEPIGPWRYELLLHCCSSVAK